MPRRAPRLLVLFALLAWPSQALAAGPRITKGPYLQELGPSGVVIKVEVDPPSPMTLEVVAAEDDLIPPEAGPDGAAKGVKIVEAREASGLQVLRVEGLEPHKRYTYGVGVGIGSARAKERNGGTFTTSPKPGAAAPFTFLLYGDNRSDPDAHGAVVRAMQNTQSDFLVHTGDFIEDGRAAGDWQQFFDIEHTLLRDHCVFAAVGNHELIEKAGETYLRYFGPAQPARLFSSFRWGDARFFLLNGSDTFTDGPEAAWLKQELERADSEAGLSWRFVVVHHGPWSAGPHGNNVRLLAGNAEELFAKHKIDAIFSGHDHIYERGNRNGMRYVVSGGGGAPLYPIKTPLASTRKAESAHHFVEVSVAQDGVKMVVRRPTGAVLERCGFAKTAGWDCDSAPVPTLVPDDSSAQGASAPVPPQTRASASRCGCRIVGEEPHAALLAPFAVLIAGLATFARRARTRRFAQRARP